MTVELGYAPVSYNGTGAQVDFPTTWRFLDEEDLVVKKTVAGVTSTLVLDVDYTVAGAGAAEPGGTVTTLVAPALGSTLAISRLTPITQPNSFRQLGPFSPDTWERTVDRITLWGQENRYRIGVLEALGSLVNVSTLAAGVQLLNQAFTVDADAPEETFPTVLACAGGLNAKHMFLGRVWKTSAPDTRIDDIGPPEWKPGPGANEVTLLWLPGLEPGVNYTVNLLVLF